MVASGVNRAAISGSGGPAGVGSGGVPFRRARCFILLGLLLGYDYIGEMNTLRVRRAVPLVLYRRKWLILKHESVGITCLLRWRTHPG